MNFLFPWIVSGIVLAWVITGVRAVAMLADSHEERRWNRAHQWYGEREERFKNQR